MEHGPPCYRDLESEEMELLASFRVRTVFPDEVLEEVRHLPEDPEFELETWRRQWSAVEAEMRALTRANDLAEGRG